MKSSLGLILSVALLISAAAYTNAFAASNDGAAAAPAKQAPSAVNTDGRKQPTYSDFFGGKHSTLSPAKPSGTANIRVQIGKDEYSIPANYLDMTPNPDCANGGILMFALLPNFEGRTPANNRFFHMFDKERPWATINIESWPGRKVSIEEAFANDLKVHHAPGEFNQAEDRYGLEFWKNKQKHGIGGLMDLFVNRQNGKVLSFISCYPPDGPPDAGTNPNCTDAFILNDEEVKFLFPLGWLPQWHTLEENARKFVKSLTVGLAVAPMPACKN